MSYQSNKVLKGVVLHKTVYRETSLICQVYTAERGRISVMAKGVRKPTNSAYGLLQVLSELEFTLLHKKESSWYILKSAQHLQSFENTSFITTTVMLAGAELYNQLYFAEHETCMYYQLLINFLSYTSKIDKNALPLFWRLLVKIFELHGIFADYNICALCRQPFSIPAAYSKSRAAFICQSCVEKAGSFGCVELSAEERKLIDILPQIGNHLSDLDISPAAAQQLTFMLIDYLNHHFNGHFHFKTLQTLFNSRFFI